jgi:adenine-specific DNA-methyltransferase
VSSPSKTPPTVDQIVHGDCLQLLRGLPDGSVDLIVSSPPYNIGKEYEARRALQHYLAEQSVVLHECARVLRSTGSIFWQVGAFSDSGSLIPLDVRFFPILEDCGLIPRNRIMWVRQHGLHANRKFSCRHESILWFTKGERHKFKLDEIRVPQKYQNKKAWTGEKKGQLTCNPDGKNPGDIWIFRNVKHNHEEQTIHPCQFPEDMIARVVLAVTDPGDLVFDPYMGTGTVAVVARDHGRHFLGAELDPKYHAVAQRRLRGEPDEHGSFANLKTLRDYCERTGQPVERFRFDMQVGEVASDRSKAKIYPEEHHLVELEERLSYEEDAFAADLRGHARPIDHKLNGGATGKPRARSSGASLFGATDA